MTIFWPRVAVLGVGLIGGSMAGALKKHRLAGHVVGFAPDGSAQEALQLGLLDQATNNLTDAARAADLIVLAAPVMQLPALLQDLGPLVANDCVITDCASTKCSVIAAAQEHLGSAFSRFVPGHPIAGSERSGPAAAKAELFNGARVVLCADERCDERALDQVAQTWTAVGARVSHSSAAQHDRLFAVVSHWPHAVAFALSAAIANSDVADEARLAAGAGLRDTTRIAASSPSLWAEILLDNRQQSLRAAHEFRHEFDSIVAMLERGDKAGLERVIALASGWRRGVQEPTIFPKSL